MFKRKGRIVGHSIKIEFKEGAKITQQKGRLDPLQLQKAVDAEIRNLLQEDHIRKIDKITDEMFIQPVVFIVKKDRSFKFALDARSLNNAILKNKYQMPFFENLMDKIAEIINGKEEGGSFSLHWMCFIHMVKQYSTRTQQNIAISKLSGVCFQHRILWPDNHAPRISWTSFYIKQETLSHL